MSDTHEEAHTGPIKNPKQLLVTVIAAFVIPVFIIIGLVYFVTSKDKPAAGNGNPEKALAERIQKVGSVEIRDANRPLRNGDEVYKVQCAACHGTGAAGAPKFEDAAAWAPRLKQGFEALVQSSLRARAPWLRKAAATSTTSKSLAAWLTWPTQLAASSLFQRSQRLMALLLQPQQPLLLQPLRPNPLLLQLPPHQHPPLPLRRL